MNKCLNCGSKDVDSRRIRYFPVPGVIMVPNSYILCKEHENLNYYYDDIYDEKGKRKKINHEEVIYREK